MIVGYALEYFKNQYGDTQFHLVAIGLLLALVVLFMPDGVMPGRSARWSTGSGRTATSIREETAADLPNAPRGARRTHQEVGPMSDGCVRSRRDGPAPSPSAGSRPSTAPPSPSSTARSTR